MRDKAIVPLSVTAAFFLVAAVIAGAFYFAGDSDSALAPSSGQTAAPSLPAPDLDTTVESFVSIARSSQEHLYVGKTIRVTGKIDPGFTLPDRFPLGSANGTHSVICYATNPGKPRKNAVVQGVYFGKENHNPVLKTCVVIK